MTRSHAWIAARRAALESGARRSAVPRLLPVLALAMLSACCTSRAACLPLIERGTAAPAPPYFVLFLTGDGGWRKIDAQVAARLNEAQIPVAGLLSNRYFTRAFDADALARDVERAIELESKRFGARRVLLVGYSRGADAIPVILAHLRPEVKERLVGAALLGPERRSELQIRRWVWSRPGPEIDLAEELSRAGDGTALLCVQGTDERGGLCDAIGPRAVQLRLEGGHHFGGKYAAIGEAIVAFAAKEVARGS